MRILHTSDWHIGKRLPDGRDRLEEQREALEALEKICREKAVDLVLVAGDVFDTASPSAAAETLFYETLEKLGRVAPVLIVAGNHDSPERLCAARPLAARHGVLLWGLPGEMLAAGTAGSCEVEASGADWAQLRLCDGQRVVIAALPYPSPARLAAHEAEVNEKEAPLGDAYAEQLRRRFVRIAEHFREDAVNLAMSHLFVLGGQPAGDERSIELGGALLVPPEIFPQAQYTALGHLHGYQRMRSEPPVAYSGALLSCRFGERSGMQGAVLVEAEPGGAASLTRVAIPGGRPMVTWKVNGVDEALARAVSDTDEGAWIELTILTDEPVTAQQIAQLRRARPGIVQIIPLRTDEAEERERAEARASLPPERLFADFYRAKKGTEPQPELTEYFLSVLQRHEEGEAHAADTTDD